MNFRLQALLDDLDRAGDIVPSGLKDYGQWIHTATLGDIDDLLAALVRRRPPEAGQPEEMLLAAPFAQLTERFRAATTPASSPPLDATTPLGATTIDQIVSLYGHLGPKSGARHHLLAVLSGAGNSAGLKHFAELLATDPPDQADQAAMALVPLFQREDYDPATLFPRLLDGIEHLNVAAPILDLANWLMEGKIAPRHPAADRAEGLITLLGGLAERLGRLEERPTTVGDAPAKRQWQFVQSVDLVVSLCRALALIGDESAVGVLDRVLKLGHRRLRCEAAAAMARLNQQDGAEALLALAAEPVVRLRVLAYARELDLLDQIDRRFTSPAAKAEGELVGWLAQPGQMGIPPSECELIDSRTQYWPGYERPVACYLFAIAIRFRQSCSRP